MVIMTMSNVLNEVYAEAVGVCLRVYISQVTVNNGKAVGCRYVYAKIVVEGPLVRIIIIMRCSLLETTTNFTQLQLPRMALRYIALFCVILHYCVILRYIALLLIYIPLWNEGVHDEDCSI